MLKHQGKWLAFISVIQPIQGDVGGDVRHIAVVALFCAHFNKIGVVIRPLSGQDIPVIETGGDAFQVPFANHGRLVAGLLQQFGKGLLAPVKLIPIVAHTVQVAVFSGQNRGPAGCAKTISTKGVFKAHSFLCQSVDVGRFVNFASVGTDSIGGVIIGHDENDIGSFGPSGT